MTMLVLGLIVFLGTHSTRIFADGWRSTMLARMGEKGWKGAYSVISLIGFVLIVIGYGAARAEPVVIWNPPVWTRHVAALLTLPAFILLVAAHVPANMIKVAVGHPMVAGVKLWAFSHLLANGMLADVLLFGSFLVWAVADFIVSRRRDRIEGVVRAGGTMAGTAITVVAGTLLWAAFAFWLHRVLIGVAPFG